MDLIDFLSRTIYFIVIKCLLASIPKHILFCYSVAVLKVLFYFYTLNSQLPPIVPCEHASAVLYQKRCKIQHNLWKLIYKYVDIHFFLCICFKKQLSRKESFLIFFIMSSKTASRLLPSFYSFLPIFLVFVIQGSSSVLSLHCNYFKKTNKQCNSVTRKRRKLWGVALWLKLVRWQPHRFTPLPFSNGCTAVSFFQ